nr:EboA domain-containing protein [Streptomyces antioxidans]
MPAPADRSGVSAPADRTDVPAPADLPTPADGPGGPPAPSGHGGPSDRGGPSGPAHPAEHAAPIKTFGADGLTPHDLPDAARVLILHAARADARTVARLYAYGTGAERRAVLRALPHLDLFAGPDAVPLVEDALRTNDTRLVAAAVGPYAARHLPPHGWRQAVLKCLFTGVPLAAVADWERRARGDGELGRMLGDYARERTAAGRPVPGDLDRVLAVTQTLPATSAEPGSTRVSAEPGSTGAPAEPAASGTPADPAARAALAEPDAPHASADPGAPHAPYAPRALPREES